MRGYKIFGPDYTCKNYKYSLDTPNKYIGDLEMFECGFHFCQRAIDCLDYYDYNSKNTYAEVECGDEYIIKNKVVVCRELKITKILTYSEFGELITFDVETPQRKCSYFLGKLNGIVQEYYNGKLIVEIAHINGNPVGIFRQWYPNGQLMLETTRNGDITHGRFRQWYSNGQLKIDTNYVNDQKHGSYKQWDENGKLKMSTKYKNGEPVEYYKIE